MMNWSALPYYDSYNINSPPLINNLTPQTLYMGNDTIPKSFLDKGFDFLKPIKSCMGMYKRNNILEKSILEQINETQNSSDYHGCHYDYQCFVFCYENLYLISIVTDEFCL